MKKSILKIISFGITLCMLFSLFVPMLVTSAAETNSNSLIFGKVPYEFYRSPSSQHGTTTTVMTDIVEAPSRPHHPYYRG